MQPAIFEGTNHEHKLTKTLRLKSAHRPAPIYLHKHRALPLRSELGLCVTVRLSTDSCFIVITERLMLWRGRALMDLSVDSVVCPDFPRSATHTWMGDFNPVCAVCPPGEPFLLWFNQRAKHRGQTWGTRPSQSARRTRPLHSAGAGMEWRVNPQQHGLDL